MRKPNQVRLNRRLFLRRTATVGAGLLAAAIFGLPHHDPRALEGLPDNGRGVCDICGEAGCIEACLIMTGEPMRALRAGARVEWKVRAPDIVGRALTRCRTCGRLTGHVDERYNGRVPVRCLCPRHRPLRGRRGPLILVEHGRTQCPGPSMVSLPGDRATWRPVSDYVAEDGRKIHVPWFHGYALKQPGFGFSLLSD